MPKFAANLTFLFGDAPFLDRFERASQAGFTTVEFMFPYEYEVEDLHERMRRFGLSVELFNVPVPEFTAGGRGIAVDPARVGEFRTNVSSALKMATALGTDKLNCLVGHRSSTVSWDEQYACLIENLRWATERAKERGTTLLLEQLNPIDNPGYFLDALPLVERAISDVGSPNLRLQFDMFHVQRTHGDLIATLQRLLPLIAHVQIADSPHRSEPGTGEIAFGNVLHALDAVGYQGHIGLEYRPSRVTEETFDWVEANGWHIA